MPVEFPADNQNLKGYLQRGTGIEYEIQGKNEQNEAPWDKTPKILMTYTLTGSKLAVTIRE